MAKEYSNVSNLVRDVVQDEEIRATTEKRLVGRALVKHLLAMRAVEGLSQQDIAGMLDCTQSRISKLEKSLDDDIRLGDFRAYAKAVGHEFVCGMRPVNMKPFDAVKCHVFSIKKHMDYLAGLAKKDEAIAKAVAGFFAELFFNFARLFGDSVKQLPLAPNAEPYLNIHVNATCFCEEESTEEPEEPIRDSAGHLLSATL